MEMHSIQALRERAGLRLVIVQGAPSPWGQAAKAMMEHKQLEFAMGLQIPRAPNEALLEWAGVNNAPVVAWNDERPINAWLDILNLLERLAPHRPLLPRERAERAEVIGLSNEICGVQGLGWMRRLSLYKPALSSAQPPASIVHMGRKYGYSEAAAAAAAGEQIAILELLTRRLRDQGARGREYLVGEEVSAADFYWASFSTIFALPSADKVPVQADRRAMFETIEPEVRAALSPELMAHRERMLERHFKLPMEF